jgi:spermidine/putrescine transport system substrate-binding protein
MTQSIDKPNADRATLAAARSFRRRTLLEAAAATGIAAIAAPWGAKRALSSSGVVNVFTWSDYVYQDMIDGFEKETGIKVNLSKYGSNDEVFNKIKASGGKGFDVVQPTTSEGPTYYDAGDLLQPIDESKVNIDAVYPSIYEKSIDLGGTYRGKRYILPFNWGTEAMTYDSSVVKGEYGTLSLGDLWNPDYERKVTGRPKSLLIAIGRHLDATGELPSNGFLDAYESEEKARALFAKTLEFAIAHKKSIRSFWNNTDETLNAFNNDGCVIGLTWDGPGITLMKNTQGRIKYLMPKEGGFAWLDGLAIPSGAENIEQAYAWINYMYRPEVGASHANQSGYNSAVAEAVNFLKPESKAAFEAAYPPGAVDNLWWWPMTTPWFNPVRQEYVEKYIAAA